MIKLFKKHSLFFVILIFYALLSGIILYQSVKINFGNLVFTVDDAYIHLAFCKNIILNGVAGISKFVPASLSSSPMWTLIIAVLFRIFGVSDIYPLLINLFSGMLLLIFIYKITSRFIRNKQYIFLILVMILSFSYFFLTLFSGMEHIIFSLLLILFLDYSANYFNNKNEDSGNKSFMVLLLLTFLLTSLRYEGLFAVSAIIIFLIHRKKFRDIFIVFFVAILPLILYGIWSYYSTSDFYSNTLFKNLLLIKTIRPFISENIFGFFKAFIDNNPGNLVKLFLATVVSLTLSVKISKKLKTYRNYYFIISFIYGIAVVLQCVFFNAFYFRYSNPIIIAGIFVTGIVAFEYFKENIWFKKVISFKLLFIPIVLIFFYKGYASYNQTVLSSNNIYEQQYQMGLFLKEFYNNETIAANDVGLINYIADIKCVDLAGLGTKEVLKSRLSDYFNTERIYDICSVNKVKVAILYESWYDIFGGLPGSWVKAGTWKIRNNYICGEDNVSFYAVESNEANNLFNHLKLFSVQLPPTIIQSGKYTGENNK